MSVAEEFDLLVIGGGPAGMSAAIEARRAGVQSVCLLDDGPALGGQIFRRYGDGFSVVDPGAAGHEYVDGEALIRDVERSGVDIRTGTVVWGIWDKRVAFVQGGTTSGAITARAIILATGARDRPVAFPGWTLPGVFTAGAAKTLVAIQRVLPGERILMAGSGPLALAFSAQLRGYGANIVEVVEAAPRPGPAALARLASSGEAATLFDAVKYRLQLATARVPLSPSTIIVRAEGSKEVEGAVVAKVDENWRVVPGTERTVDVDTILVGYGLESSSELTRLSGCRHVFDRQRGGWIAVKDDAMRTSIPGLFAAGDGSGIGGWKQAAAEGRVAGIMAAGEIGVLDASSARERAAPSRQRLSRLKAFGAALNRIYAVGPGLYELATPETIVCRCEQRTAADLDAVLDEDVVDVNIVRALSRIGMGRCQGRNCASHVAAAIARRTSLSPDEIAPLSPRPPVKPVPIIAIASERMQHDSVVEVH